MQLIIDLETVDRDELAEINVMINRIISINCDDEVAPVTDITDAAELIESNYNVVDKHGREWDDRIDSTPATLTDKGEFRARRKPKDMSSIDWKHFCNSIKGGDMPVEAHGEETPAETDESIFDAPTADMDYITFKKLVIDKIMNADFPDFTPRYANDVAAKHGAANLQEVKDKFELIPALALEFEI